MAFAAGRVLAFPAFYHDQGFLAVITFHDAGDPVTGLQAAVADRTDRLIPITLNEKHLDSRCKQDCNLAELP